MQKTAQYVLSCLIPLLLCGASDLSRNAETSAISLQVGAFRQAENAQHLQQRLAQLTPKPSNITVNNSTAQPMHVVTLDNFHDLAEAHKLQQRLAIVGFNTRLRQQHLREKISGMPAPRQDTPPPDAGAERPTHITITPRQDKKRLWNLRNADVRTVIEAVSHETGRNFIVDPRVQGKITIVSATPLSSDEVYQVFLSMLEVSGFATIPTGQAIKIVPSIDSNGFATRVENNLYPHAHGDELIVRVIPIKYVSAQQLVPILRPLMPQWGHISAYIPSNSLIISGRANNLDRMLTIIQNVDTASQNDIDVIPLHYALAQDAANTLKELRKTASITDNQNISIAPDIRSNSVLISGPRAQRLRFRVLLSELDSPSASGINGTTQVIHLKYLKAQDLVPILAGVAKSRFKGNVGVTIGTRTVDTTTRLDKKETTTNNNVNYTGDNQQSEGNQAQPLQTSQSSNDQQQPSVEIVAEQHTNSVILNAPPSVMVTLKSVINQLDVRPAQILVEAMIVEVDENDVNGLGIDWGTRNDDLTTNNYDPAFSAGFGIITRKGFSTFEAQIQALATLTKANILSTPSIVVLDNHLAHIKVGQEVSIIKANYPNNANATTTASPYNVFDRKDVALVLNVTPQITDQNGVRLTIAHQNDTLRDPSQVSTTPVFNISEIRTSVLVDSGDILVLGGLIRQQTSEVDQRVPILGKLPGIGRLFHHVTHTQDKKKLLVFLRTTILKTSQASTLLSGERYEQARADQLLELRKQPYKAEDQATVLQDIHQKAALPAPFSSYYPPRSRFRYRQNDKA